MTGPFLRPRRKQKVADYLRGLALAESPAELAPFEGT
jgi:hypothetical protein